MGLDYVDIFYHHRQTLIHLLEETAEALMQLVDKEKHYILVYPTIMEKIPKK